MKWFSVKSMALSCLLISAVGVAQAGSTAYSWVNQDGSASSFITMSDTKPSEKDAANKKVLLASCKAYCDENFSKAAPKLAADQCTCGGNPKSTANIDSAN